MSSVCPFVVFCTHCVFCILFSVAWRFCGTGVHRQMWMTFSSSGNFGFAAVFSTNECGSSTVFSATCSARHLHRCPSGPCRPCCLAAQACRRERENSCEGNVLLHFTCHCRRRQQALLAEPCSTSHPPRVDGSWSRVGRTPPSLDSVLRPAALPATTLPPPQTSV